MKNQYESWKSPGNLFLKKGTAIQFQTKSCLFLGKILNDDQPLSEYKIDEKGFVVVMVTKVIIFNSYVAELHV